MKPANMGCKSMVEGPTIMLGVFITCYTPIQCQTSTIQAPTCCYTPTWWPNLPEVGRKSRFFPDLRHETRQHGAVKVWWRAYNHAGSVHHLLYTYTMPNIYYSSTYMLLYPHLMAKLAWSWQEIEIFSWSEAWNPPTWGCKSMVEGLQSCWECSSLVIHLYNAKHLLFKQPTCCYTPTWWPNLPEVGRKSRFFPDLRHETRQHGAVKVWWRAYNHAGSVHHLLYTYTMPNIYYSSTYMLLYPHLMAKLAWSWQEIEIFSWSEAWNPPTWGCKSMVEGLQSCWECSSLVIHLYNAKHLLFKQPTCCYTPTWWPNLPEVGRKSRFFPDLRHETRQHGAVKVWWRDYNHAGSVHHFVIHLYNAKHLLFKHLHAAIPPLDGQTCLRVGRKSKIFSWSEAWNPPTWGCKSMVEGLQSCWECSSLCYTSIQCQTSTIQATYMLLYPHLMAKLAWSWQEIEIFSWSEAWNPPTWGCKSMVEGLQSCWECSSLCYTSIQCQTSTIQAPTCCYTPTWWPNLPESWQEIEIFSWSEAWNPPTWGCKSMVEGLTIMLGVFITLLYIHTMPNIYYSSNLHAAIPPLDGQTCLRVGRKSKIFSWSEAWNPPTWGCKSMVEGLTIMLGVFITLLYIHTMPNIYYSSNLHAAIPPLDGQTCLRVGRKSKIFSWSEAWNPPTWGCKSMVEGPTIMLGVFITLLYIHTMPNIYYSATYMLLYPHLMAKLAWSWQEIEIFSWSEAWNPPTWGCKSMVEGPTIMLGVFITLLYIHTMPNIYYSATYMLLYPHLMAKLAWELAGNRDFFLIWGMKPANMGL